MKTLLSQESGIQVVGEAEDAAAALEKTADLQPDVILLDVTLPDRPGIEIIAELRKRADKARVVLLTMHDDPAYLRRGLAEGAAGYLVKSAAETELLDAIRAVSAGRSYIAVSLDDRALKAAVERTGQRTAAPGADDSLSDRERQVLELVSYGYTNREVAEQLGLSVKSVETYRARVLAKLGLKTRAELVRYALDRGILGHAE